MQNFIVAKSTTIWSVYHQYCCKYQMCTNKNSLTVANVKVFVHLCGHYAEILWHNHVHSNFTVHWLLHCIFCHIIVLCTKPTKL